MVTKMRSGSERVQPGSRDYLAIEQACQSGLSSHPKGMALPVPDRRRSARTGAYWPALRASPSPASSRSHVTALIGRGPTPSSVMSIDQIIMANGDEDGID